MSGVVQVKGELIATRRVGAYHHLTLWPRRGRAGPPRAVRRPGRGRPDVGEPAAPVLLDPQGQAVGHLRRHRRRRRRRARRRARCGSPGCAPHDPVDVVGPLGRPFPLPDRAGGLRAGRRWLRLCPAVLAGRGAARARLPRRDGARRGEPRTGCSASSRRGARPTVSRSPPTTARPAPEVGSATCSGEVIGRSRAASSTAAARWAMLRSVTEVAAAQGAVAQVAVEESMACGVGVCMTCVMPVTGADGATRMVRRASRDRCSAATGCGGTPSRTASASCRPTPWRADGEATDGVDMSVTLAASTLPNPLMTASGCAANGKELHRFFDVSSWARSSRSRSWPPAVRARHAADGRDPVRDAQLDRAAGPGDRRVPRERPALAAVGRGPGPRVDRRRAARSSPTSPRPGGSAGLRRVVGVEVNISCPNVANRGRSSPATRWPRPRSSRSSASSCPADIPVLRQAQSRRHRHRRRSPAACVKAGADGLTLINTLLGMVIDTDRLRPSSAA